MNKFDSMNRNELRVACKEAGIKYGKLTVPQMREALAASEKTEASTESVPLDQMDSTGANGTCPHCAIHLSNGVANFDDLKADSEVEREWICLACSGQFGPKARRKQADRHNGKGLKIEKNRETRNGITKPSAGGKCRMVWDYLDSVVAQGETPTAKTVRKHAEQQGWNANNASIELYQWRKFHGITGRR